MKIIKEARVKVLRAGEVRKGDNVLIDSRKWEVSKVVNYTGEGIHVYVKLDDGINPTQYINYYKIIECEEEEVY